MTPLKQRVHLPFLCLCVLVRPQWMAWDPPHMGEVIFFAQSTDSNLFSSGNTFTDTPRNNVLPAIWPSLNPIKSAHKISHHGPSSPNNVLCANAQFYPMLKFKTQGCLLMTCFIQQMCLEGLRHARHRAGQCWEYRGKGHGPPFLGYNLRRQHI